MLKERLFAVGGARGKIDSERSLPLDFVEQRSEESSVKAQIVDRY